MTFWAAAALLALLFGVVCLLILAADSLALARFARAIDTFVKDKRRAPLNLPRGVPGSVHRLASAFARLVAEVEQLRRRDAEVAKIKSDFMTTVAHQLQTPLTGITWAAEGLKGSVALAEGERALVAQISERGQELTQMVHSFLEISNLESGRYTYAFAPLSIAPVVIEVVNGCKPKADAAQVNLSLKVTEGLPLVRADRARIKQALAVLIENAIRYTPAGGRVSIEVVPGPRLIAIHVADTGIGILEGDRSNIFELFYRGGQARTKAPSGSGLDLYIARLIARAHGGDLIFHNNTPAPGTTFTLSLPTVL